ncbi:MAG: LacI family transcriptional regulator [Firmicutes bacterium]|nr:LacI family transcriptional regulator [Bacillota bacterium]
MSPTIRDVAQKAGVSVATVSRVVNDRPGYSAETRNKVLRVIEELGYQPNALARGLVSKRSRTVGVLIPNISSMVASEMLKGIEDAAHTIGQSVIVCNTDNNGERTLEYLQVLKEKQVDGIIVVSAPITPLYHQKFGEMQVPVVLVSTRYHDGNLPFVKVDDEKAAYHATAYLIKKGHEEIGMIAGSKDDRIAGIPRVEGYRKALSDHGIPIRDQYITYGNFGFQSGMAGLERLLEAAPEITAIFCASDEMAAGALSLAHRRGIEIPDRLSLIGYDDSQLAEMTIPPLTTLRQPLCQMGQEGLTMLMAMIEEGKRTIHSKILPYTIVERETVRELR